MVHIAVSKRMDGAVVPSLGHSVQQMVVTLLFLPVLVLMHGEALWGVTVSIAY